MGEKALFKSLLILIPMADSSQTLSMSYSTMRAVTFSSVAALVIVAVSAFFLVYRSNENAGKRAYFISQTGSVAALLAGNDVHTPFEARNLVGNFMRSMFGHDQYSFKANLDAALPWIDGVGGKRIYEGFTQGQVYSNYVRYSARSVVSVDSVVVDMQHRPWSGQVYIKQRLFIGSEQKEPLPLAAKFNLEETNRSDANPYGLLITNFDYIPYAPAMSRGEAELLKQQEAERLRIQRESQSSGLTPGVGPGAGPAPAPTTVPDAALPRRGTR